MFQGRFLYISRKFKGFLGVSRMFQKNLKGASRKFQGALGWGQEERSWEPHGKAPKPGAWGQGAELCNEGGETVQNPFSKANC